MFCKWCGGNLASSDTKCKRCGKEVPALSDCGGFYDLVPNASKPVERHTGSVMSDERPVPPLKKPEPPVGAVPARGKNSHKESSSGLFVLTIVGFAVVFLLLVIILGKVNGFRNDLQIINEKIDALQAETPPVEPEAEIMEPVGVLAPILAEQDVIFTVTIPGEDSVEKIEAGLNLGDYTDTAVITYGLDEMTGMVNSVGYSLEEANTTVSLTIDRSIEFRSRTVSVSYVIDDTIYGLSEAPETFKWQYRLDAESDWIDLPKDAFVQTDITGKTGLTIRDTALQELLTDHEGQLELRCEIYRTNTDDGSLAIVIEGIRFYDEENNEG